MGRVISPKSLAASQTLKSNPLDGIEAGARRKIRHEFDRANGPFAANVAHIGMLPKR